MKTKFFFSILSLTVLFSCKKDSQDISSKPENLQYYQAFSSNSVFYNPIGNNPQIDPNSTVMVGSLIEQQESQGFLIAVKEWTVPVYFADASTEKQDVSMSASWAPLKTLKNVPIPEYAEPDPSGDGHMVVIDEAGGCIYDFWEMKLKSGGWQAGWGNALPLSGNGVFPKGLVCKRFRL